MNCKALVKSGQQQETAEAIVELITDVHEQVATKSNIELLEQRLTVKIYTVGIGVVGILTALKYWG